MEKKLLLIGEPMGIFMAKQEGKFRNVSEFIFSTCGAELNVAVGMTRLEHKVAYVTKLGKDLFAEKIIDMMEKTGISTDYVTYSDDRNTGFMFKSATSKGDPEIAYFRKGSAASTLSPADIDEIDMNEFDFVHITGITPALTESTRATADALIEKARQNNITFSFDPNLRLQLWNDKEFMKKYINETAFKADYFFPGINELKILINEDNVEKAAQYYLERGTKNVIIKIGGDGAYYATATASGYVKGFKVDRIVDTVGAGDGFAAGVISALKEGLPVYEAVRRGNAIGAIQVMSKGDNDGLPTRKELNDFMNGKKDWRKN